MADDKRSHARDLRSAERTASVSALYAAERSMGFQAQTGILTAWVAATTYFTASLGILAVLRTGAVKDSLGPSNTVILLYIVSYLSCAFAMYHLLLFGIGSVHSRSIRLLEEALVEEAPKSLRSAYYSNPGQIGSRAETDWSEGSAMPLFRVVSFLCFPVPYAAAVLVTVECLRQIESLNAVNSIFFGVSVAGYVLFGVLCLALVVRIVLSLNEAKNSA